MENSLQMHTHVHAGASSGAATSFDVPDSPSVNVSELAIARVGAVEGLLGESAAIQTLSGQIRRVAQMRISLLIMGESGTGKELVAKCLHDLSRRAAEPLLAVDCGAIASSQLEAELFGCEHGNAAMSPPQSWPASWAATGPREGYFERAAAGTLLLDEITEMPVDMQAKLLRVLESNRLTRVGGDREIEIRCRVLATTSHDPQQAVATGRLHADLLHRLAVFPIAIPPLRERDDDVELLAQHFLAALNAEERVSKHFSADSLLCLRQHPWPGNVRELRNAVERAFILADGDLNLRAVVDKPLILSAVGDEAALRIPVGTSLAEAERWMIVATLKKCGGNKTRAAALLGVSLKTLYNRLNAYRAQGLDVSDPDREFTEVAS